MKLIVKTMLLMSVASGAFANTSDCGVYVRGQLGSSKAVDLKKDSLLSRGQGGTKSNNFGVYGGIGVEARRPLAHYHPSLVGGFGVDVNIESTKYTQSGRPTTLGGRLDTQAKRQVVVNILGQLGWKLKNHFKRNITPYAVAGASYAKFDFSNTWASTSSTKASASKTKGAIGWAAGVGVALKINQKMSTDLRYLYTAYGKVDTQTSLSGVQNCAKAPRAYHAVTVGVSYKI